MIWLDQHDRSRADEFDYSIPRGAVTLSTSPEPWNERDDPEGTWTASAGGGKAAAVAMRAESVAEKRETGPDYL